MHNKNNIAEQIQQNKMAAMGEMFNHIAHQWRQPLMEINSLFLPHEAKIKLNQDINNNELLESIKNLHELTQYMSKTIEDFKNFFAKDKEEVFFKISDQLNFSLNIMGRVLKHNNIHVDIIMRKNPSLYGYKNEYAQVLINIINNAKDVLIQKNIKNPSIIIDVYAHNKHAIVSIEDNAGGINEEIKEHIFEPFFTANKKEGTGLGLFMSKLIIENNMNGTLSVENTQKGAKFIICIPTSCQL